jgi:anthranilate phosphoribosyltransferase
MKTAIAAVVDGKDLSREEAQRVAELILTGQANEIEIAGFLTALRMKGETVDEILGFASVLRSKANTISPKCDNYVDLVGTGGDCTYSFNISTTSAFVVAGAGLPVAKHGNRSISSKSGAADVLEALGVNIAADPAVVEKCVEEAGVGFMMAPHFNPCMKYVGPVRKALGIRTVFNILGPLSNPSRAKKMVVGVYNPKMVETIAKVMAGLDVKRGFVVSGDNFMDEFNLAGESTVAEIRDGEVTVFTVKPEDFGLKRCTLDDLRGGEGPENAKITRAILEGKEQGAKREAILLNAGATLYIGGLAESIADGIRLAAESIDSGKALAVLDKMVKLSNN